MWGQYYISESCVYSDHVCEINYSIPIDDNFDEKSKISDLRYWILIPLSILPIIICNYCFVNIATKYWDFEWKTGRTFSICMSLYIVVYYLLIILIPSNYETCSFPISCHEGLNNTIITTNYYFQMKECPKSYSWLTYDYSELYNYNQDCSLSKWGCCTIDRNITCAEFHDETFSYYNNVKDEYDGYWTFHIDKIDEQGSNCPSIEKMIYEISVNEKKDYILLSMLITACSTIILVILNLFLICQRKTVYIQTDNPSETSPISKRNEILIGSA